MSTTRFTELGELIASFRARAAIATQGDLAKLMGISQQAVSRWESGTSRPRVKDLQRLAKALAVDEEPLFNAAGYSAMAKPTSLSFDKTFPMNGLSPESFERFCAYLLDCMYTPIGGSVHAAGSTGHTQHGIDISAIGPFGKHVFQCKRVDEFGPSKVRAAAAHLTIAADMKVLLLSNIASHDARLAVEQEQGWDIWDREDISREMRKLPMSEQTRLVDTFFRGQRRTLLGIPEAGPLITQNDFFGPFADQARMFNHQWALVGRGADFTALLDAVQDEDTYLTMLVGAPGGGKTRLLRAVTEHHAFQKWEVLFASPTENVTSTLLQGLGSNKRLIIVDDAHERDDIEALLHYCAGAAHQTRLLLAMRPYGTERTRLQAAKYGLGGADTKEVTLSRYSVEEATELASNVLRSRNGDTLLAKHIAIATYRNPLVTVIASQIVAKEGTKLAFVGNVVEFQREILSRFQDVIANEIVVGQDRERLPQVLKLVCLLQPVMPDDPSLLALIEKMEGIGPGDAARLIKLLIDGGLLFRRGLRYRISPDLLADSVIQRHCIAPDGSSTGYVERLFSEVKGQHSTNLLTNVGSLDWRLNEGDPESSTLLDGMWEKLEWRDDYVNADVEAAASVAYYQPRKALDFAVKLIRQGKGHDSKVCQLISNAAFNLKYLRECCELLWHAGKNDARELHQQPYHGVRLLKELAEYEPHKPPEFIDGVVSFGIDLLSDLRNLDGVYTPFDILEGALSTEGHSTVATSRRQIQMRTFTADLNVVMTPRKRVIEKALECIATGDSRQGYLAARLFAQALRSPAARTSVEADGTGRDAWFDEHEKTIRNLRHALAKSDVHSAVLFKASEAVSWHAIYGLQQTKREAAQIIELLDRDIDTRLTRVLLDGWGHCTWPIEVDTSKRTGVEVAMSSLVDDLKASFTANQLFRLMESHLKDLASVTRDSLGSSHVFIEKLLRAVDGFADEALQAHTEGSAGSLERFSGAAMAVVLERSPLSLPANAKTGTLERLRLLAKGYAWRNANAPYSPNDIDTLREICASTDEEVLRYAGQITLQASRQDAVLALELIGTIDIGKATAARHEIFMWLTHENTIPSKLISTDLYKKLLSGLLNVQDLDDHWVNKFLRMALHAVPAELIKMAKLRVELSVETNDWGFTPLGRAYRPEESLDLFAVDGGSRIFVELLDWAVGFPERGPGLYRVGELIHALCGHINSEMLESMADWMRGGSVRHATVVAAALREGQNSMIYDYTPQLRELLNIAQSIDRDAVDSISSAIFGATISGVRSTSPGEPFPEDVRLRDYAARVIATLGRLDPAYDLFRQFHKSALDGIALQEREKRAMDAEEEDAQN